MVACSEDPLRDARTLLATIGTAGEPLDDDQLTRHTIRLAESLQCGASELEGSADRRRTAVVRSLLDDRKAQAFTTLLADRVFRSRRGVRTVQAVSSLVDALGLPRGLSLLDQLALGGVRILGATSPSLVAQAVRSTVLERVGELLADSAEPELSDVLALREQGSMQVNVNLIGESVLGEAEAEARLNRYLELLAHPRIGALSIKLSTLTSRLEPLAWGRSFELLTARYRALLAAARRHGGPHGKLLTLDMESHRDLPLTVQLFRTVLDEAPQLPQTAGIALQSYLPESFTTLTELAHWAVLRAARGGAPVRVRLVKGANLAAEQVESSQRGWVCPVLGSKDEVDANAKRLVEFATRAEFEGALDVGVGSHNVFDLAFALVLRAARRREGSVTVELLAGMAEPLARALVFVGARTLVYTPIVDTGSTEAAIAYLTRRLDESTSPENFLRRAFTLQVGDAAWNSERARFVAAFRARNSVESEPRRRQDRSCVPAAALDGPFANEPDTDFSLEHHRSWIAAELTALRARPPWRVRSRIGGAEVLGGKERFGVDPSRPGVVPYQLELAEEADVTRAVTVAAASRWHEHPAAERKALLQRAAAELRRRRRSLIAAMVLDGGKRVEEADAELSEAVDFAEYYARASLALEAGAGLVAHSRGPTLVAPPWNFPLAIGAGGVFAALAAGSPVLLKPALETAWVGALLAELCWSAGVPSDALQLLICDDSVGEGLVRDLRVATVLLTGASATAAHFRRVRPGLRLIAETGGKNAFIVTAAADRELAIQQVVRSAFGHAGQKCSAASLLILESELYDDSRFRQTLKDAVESLIVGPAWELGAFVTPLIRKPEGALLRALTSLEEGESWLVEPTVSADNPRLWSPGVKLGVRPGSFTHRTELFGPVLAVMRADDLEHALALANDTPYGLTAGLASLDEREQRRFLEQMRAGNLYVNRPITGALVGRQPFGGFKSSTFGPGAKAGGPSTLAQLAVFEETALPKEQAPTSSLVAAFVAHAGAALPPQGRTRLEAAARSCAHARAQLVDQDEEPIRVLGQVNVLRRRPIPLPLFRISRGAPAAEVALALVAALTLRGPVDVSFAPGVEAQLPWLERAPGLTTHREYDLTFAARLARAAQLGELEGARLRTVGPVEPVLSEACAKIWLHVAHDTALAHGRIELLHWLQEQSISIDVHRYGNLAAEPLSPIAHPAVPEPVAAARHVEAVG